MKQARPTTYRPYPHGARNLAATLKEYRERHGGQDPRSIVVGEPPADDLTHLDGVPVRVDPRIALPAGYAYLEVPT